MDGKQLVNLGRAGTGAAVIYDTKAIDRGLEGIDYENARAEQFRQKVGKEMVPKKLPLPKDFDLKGWSQDLPFLTKGINDVSKHYAINASRGIDVNDPSTGQPYTDTRQLESYWTSLGAKSKQQEAEFNNWTTFARQNKDKVKDNWMNEVIAWKNTPLEQRGDFPDITGQRFNRLEFVTDYAKNINDPTVKETLPWIDTKTGREFSKTTTEYTPLQQLGHGYTALLEPQYAEVITSEYEALPQVNKDKLAKFAADNSTADVTFTPQMAYAAKKDFAPFFGTKQTTDSKFLPKDMRGGGAGNKEAAQTFAMRVKQMMEGSEEMFPSGDIPVDLTGRVNETVQPVIGSAGTKKNPNLEFLNGMTIGQKEVDKDGSKKDH